MSNSRFYTIIDMVGFKNTINGGNASSIYQAQGGDNAVVVDITKMYDTESTQNTGTKTYSKIKSYDSANNSYTDIVIKGEDISDAIHETMGTEATNQYLAAGSGSQESIDHAIISIKNNNKTGFCTSTDNIEIGNNVDYDSYDIGRAQMMTRSKANNIIPGKQLHVNGSLWGRIVGSTGGAGGAGGGRRSSYQVYGRKQGGDGGDGGTTPKGFLYYPTGSPADNARISGIDKELGEGGNGGFGGGKVSNYTGIDGNPGTKGGKTTLNVQYSNSQTSDSISVEGSGGGIGGERGAISETGRNGANGENIRFIQNGWSGVDGGVTPGVNINNQGNGFNYCSRNENRTIAEGPDGDNDHGANGPPGNDAIIQYYGLIGSTGLHQNIQ